MVAFESQKRSPPRLLSGLVITLLSFGLVQGQTPLQQDCNIANIIWQNMGKPSSSLITDTATCCNSTLTGITCSGGRITSLAWNGKALTNSIPSEVGNLTCMKELLFNDNNLSGSLPESIANLKSMTIIRLDGNKFSGPIPSWVGNLTALNFLWLYGNQFSGSIPASICKITFLKRILLHQNRLTGSIPECLEKLQYLDTIRLEKNMLSGEIPKSIGNFRPLTELRISENQFSGAIPNEFQKLTKLRTLWIFGNNITGYPSSLSLVNEKKIFPNPMSDVPYDLVRPASVGLLSNVTWEPFMNNTVLSLRKRQVVGTQAPVTTEELIAMCPLNNVQNGDVAAGCAAGIYKRFCTQPFDQNLLWQCHDAYNRAFAASIFKSLGAVCPAWRSGPRSAACSNAISTFSYDYYIGIDQNTGKAVYLRLGSSHALQLVNNIFASRTYAPCVAPFTCYWS
jgi:hypothetical protein